MGLREGSYVKLWNAQPHGKICYCNSTVTTGNKETGYKYLFNNRVSFAGEAAEKVKSLGLPEMSDREHPTYKSVKVLGSPDIQTYDNPKAKALLDECEKGSDLYYFVLNHLREIGITVWDVEVDEKSASDTKTTNTKTSKAKPKNSKKVEEEDFMAIPEDSGDELPFDM